MASDYLEMEQSKLMVFHIDLGQVIIATLIAAVGYLMKNEITNFRGKLEKHDEIIFNLVQQVQRLIGRNEIRHSGQDKKV